jgi:hypothetical protein
MQESIGMTKPDETIKKLLERIPTTNRPKRGPSLYDCGVRRSK